MKQPIQIKAIALIALAFALTLNGCSTARLHHYVLAATYSSNYSEDYIHDYSILTVDGKETGLGSIQVDKFSEGGTGSEECCSLIPGVGKTIRVVWRVQYSNDNSKDKTFSKDVVILGRLPVKTNSDNHLLVRFFPNHQIEAEMLSVSNSTHQPDPRTDQLFYGIHVMRHFGE